MINFFVTMLVFIIFFYRTNSDKCEQVLYFFSIIGSYPTNLSKQKFCTTSRRFYQKGTTYSSWVSKMLIFVFQEIHEISLVGQPVRIQMLLLQSRTSNTGIHIIFESTCGFATLVKHTSNYIPGQFGRVGKGHRGSFSELSKGDVYSPVAK